MARKGTYTEAFVFDGIRYYAYGKSKEEAHENAIKKKFALEKGLKVTKPSDTTVASWARQWLEDYKKGVVIEPWYKTIKGIVENYIIPEFGAYKMRYIKPKDIQKFYNKHTDLSKSFGTTLVQITRQIFASAEENGIVDKDSTRNVKPPEFAEKIGHRAITDEERELTIRTADKFPETGLFYLVMLWCGLRPQEVAALQRQDIDLVNRQITVRQAKKSDDTVGRTKTKSGSRTVPIPDLLYDRLSVKHLKPTDYVFLAPRGSVHTKTTMRNQWKKFKRLMDIENGAVTYRRHVVETTLADDLTPYCYRHTYCTDLQDAGVPVTVAQRLMGHASIKVTADIYTHHSSASYEDAVRRLNEHHRRAFVQNDI